MRTGFLARLWGREPKVETERSPPHEAAEIAASVQQADRGETLPEAPMESAPITTAEAQEEVASASTETMASTDEPVRAPTGATVKASRVRGASALDWHAIALEGELVAESLTEGALQARRRYLEATGIHPSYYARMKIALRGWRRIEAIEPGIAERLKHAPLDVCECVERWPAKTFGRAIVLAQGVADGKVWAKEMKRELIATLGNLPRGHSRKPQHRAAAAKSAKMKDKIASSGAQLEAITSNAGPLPGKRHAANRPAANDAWVAATLELRRRKEGTPTELRRSITEEVATEYGISAGYLIAMTTALRGLERIREADPDFAERLDPDGSRICHAIAVWPKGDFQEGVALAKRVFDGQAPIKELREEAIRRSKASKGKGTSEVGETELGDEAARLAAEAGGGEAPAPTPLRRTGKPYGRKKASSDKWFEASREFARRRADSPATPFRAIQAEVSEKYEIAPAYLMQMSGALKMLEKIRPKDPLLAKALEGSPHAICSYLARWPEEHLEDGLALARDVLAGKADILALLRIPKALDESVEQKAMRIRPASARWHEAATALEERRAMAGKGQFAKVSVEVAEAFGINFLVLRNMSYALKGWRRVDAIDPDLADRMKHGPYEVCSALSRWPEATLSEGIAIAKSVLDGENPLKAIEQAVKDAVRKEAGHETGPRPPEPKESVDGQVEDDGEDDGEDDAYRQAVMAIVIASLGDPKQTKIVEVVEGDAIVFENAGVKTHVSIFSPVSKMENWAWERDIAIALAENVNADPRSQDCVAIAMPHEANADMMAKMLSDRELTRVKIHVIKTRLSYYAPHAIHL